eukprot:8276936-Alexandrium_andersonii.AAC.1
MTLLGGAEVGARRKRRRAPIPRLFRRGNCGAAPGPRPKRLPSGIARRAGRQARPPLLAYLALGWLAPSRGGAERWRNFGRA